MQIMIPILSTPIKYNNMQAKEWMLQSLVEYEQTRTSDMRGRLVHEQKIFDTVAFALHYLGDARLTFGGKVQEWQPGLVQQISLLKTNRDDLLILEVLQPVLLIVSKLLDLAPEGYSNSLFECCKTLASQVFDRHVNELPLKGSDKCTLVV
jgi:hypothetical protein